MLVLLLLLLRLTLFLKLPLLLLLLLLRLLLLELMVLLLLLLLLLLLSLRWRAKVRKSSRSDAWSRSGSAKLCGAALLASMISVYFASRSPMRKSARREKLGRHLDAMKPL